MKPVPIETLLDDEDYAVMASEDCNSCRGTGCVCFQWRDWQSIEYGCECGCDECGLKPPVPQDA